MVMKTIDYKKALGCYLRNTRMREGTSQEDFAHKLGINRTYYGNVERGEHSVTIDKIEAMATYLGVSVSELFLAVEQEALN
jgi:transcriptional regulator with XRE-family HTH domain